MKRKVILKRSLLLILSLLFTAHLGAQNKSITGTVKDATNGSALPGATVMIPGTLFGTVTDYEGNFELSASTGNVLSVSFIGYESVEFTVTDLLSYDIQLSPSSLEVDELVVIGYGKVKKSDATGAVVTVSAKDFNKGAITSAQDLLVGKSAGVVITASDGGPGSGSTIRIRGGSSLHATNDPLIVVDGVPIANNNVNGSANFLSFVNPNDIESMTILKDASATAIYGSRASNGVILITTKKGKAGSKFSVSYNVNTSVSQVVNLLDVYTGDEIRDIVERDSFGLWTLNQPDKLGTANTDWQNEIFRTSIMHDHNLNMTGSVKNLPYRVSVGYTDQTGIMKNTDMQRITGSVSLNPSFFDDDLKVNVNVKAMNTQNNFGDYGAMGSALNMDPTQHVFDTIDGEVDYFQWQNYGASLGTPNPVYQALEVDNRSVVNRVITNVQLDYSVPFLPGLKANLNIATDITQSDGHNNRLLNAPSNLVGEYFGRQNLYSAENRNDLLDFYLNYNTNISDNQTLDITAGYSWQYFSFESEDSTWTPILSGEEGYKPPSDVYDFSDYQLISFFGRVNYSLMDRYLLTATIRTDGSSRFDPDQRWGLFPAVAFAWKIKEESFLKDVDAVSDLKLRLGYGITGQQDILGNNYPSQALFLSSEEGYYYMIDGEWIPTLRPNGYDPFIKWEETTTKNIGLDFGFLSNRISGSLDVYNRVTNDLLNLVTVPSGSNFSNFIWTNVGDLQNNGVELSLNLIPVSTRDMNLTIGLNASYNVNEITRLILTDDPEYVGYLLGNSFTGYTQVHQVGSPASSFFLNQQVYDQNDEPIEGLYVDLSGEGGIVNGDDPDKYVIHNPAADYMFGLSLRFSYKAFDMSASARASIGNYVLNQVAAGSSYDQMFQIGYWKNFTQQLDQYDFVKRQFTSDYFLENASFLKLDNVSAGYNFQNIFDKMGLRISLTVQNVLTVTKYQGMDPEVSGGIDNSFYPRPRTIMFGLGLTY